MNPAYNIVLILLLQRFLRLRLMLTVFIRRWASFLRARYQDNIDSWEQVVEPRLRLGRESIALSASVLRQLTLAALALMSGLRLFTHSTLLPTLVQTPSTSEICACCG